MMFYPLLLSAALAAFAVAEDPVDCSQYGQDFVLIDTQKEVEVHKGDQTACLNTCDSRKPSLYHIESPTEEEGNPIVKAICRQIVRGAFLCEFQNKDDEAINVVGYVGHFNEKAENPRCVLQGSFYVEYTTNENLFKVIFIGLAVILALIILCACGIAFACGACCCRRRR